MLMLFPYQNQVFPLPFTTYKKNSYAVPLSSCNYFPFINIFDMNTYKNLKSVPDLMEITFATFLVAFADINAQNNKRQRIKKEAKVERRRRNH